MSPSPSHKPNTNDRSSHSLGLNNSYTFAGRSSYAAASPALSPRLSNRSRPSSPPPKPLYLPPIRSDRQTGDMYGGNLWQADSPSATSISSSRVDDRRQSFDHVGTDAQDHGNSHTGSAKRFSSKRKDGKAADADADADADGDGDGHGEGGNSISSPSNNKRSRVHFSCTECHRRKQKCNRQTPCQHCIARKVPDRCKTFQPGQDEAMDLTGRVARLERTVEEGFDRITAMLIRQQQQDTVPPPAQRSQEQLIPQTSPASGQSRRTQRAAVVAGTVSGENETADEDEPSQEGGLNAAGVFHASGATMAMKIDTILSDVGNMNGGETAAVRLPMRQVEPGCLDSKMWEYGAAEKVSSQLLSALPPPDACRLLLEHFWRDLNWLRHPLPETLICPMIDEFLESKGQNGKFPPTLTTSNVNIFACLSLILAVASLSVESDQIPREAVARRLTGRRLQWVGQQALLFSQVLGRDDIIQTISFAIAWRFQMVDRRINEAWQCAASAVQSAYAIGLHRDGSKLGLPQVETDLRRGIWHSVTFMDKILAMNLGRPCISAIGDVFSDVQQPTTEGLNHWWKYDAPQSHPKAKRDVPLPSIHQHTINRNHIARISGRILEMYQKIEPHHYSDVLALDAEMLQLRDNLPHYYRISTSSPGSVTFDDSLDDAFGFLATHRFLIHMEFNFTRINLHRSYLLRSSTEGSGGRRYRPSRLACIESAMQDLAMRAKFVEGLRRKYGKDSIPLSYYIQIGSYSWFNSLLIASVAALLDPASMPELPALRDQIDRFLSSHEKRKTDARAADLKDDMRDKETAIVKMFSDAFAKVKLDKGGSHSGSSEVAGAAKKRPLIAAAQEDNRPTKRRGQAGHPGDDEKDGAGVEDKGNAASMSKSGSREEATADVLLDLGKSANIPTRGGGVISTSSSSAYFPREGPFHILSTASGEASPQSQSTAGGGHPSRQSGSSSNLSVRSGDSPSSRMVDDAQADLNAWFKKEFAGGSLTENSLTDLGLPDGSRPGASGNVGLTGSSVAAEVPRGAAGSRSGYSTNNPPYSDYSGAVGNSHAAGPGAVWATLPHPTWDSTNANLAGGTSWTTQTQNAYAMSGRGGGGGYEPNVYAARSLGTGQPGRPQNLFASDNAGGAGLMSGSLPLIGQLPRNVADIGGGGAPAGDGSDSSFDPGFWAELISKISR